MIRFYEGPLRELLISPTGAVGRELFKRAFRVESAAKGRCPVDTGRLRSSIRIQTGESDAFVISVIVAATTGARVTIGSDVEYSGFVEQGTRFMRAQPFLSPALDAAMPARIIRQAPHQGG